MLSVILTTVAAAEESREPRELSRVGVDRCVEAVRGDTKRGVAICLFVSPGGCVVGDGRVLRGEDGRAWVRAAPQHSANAEVKSARARQVCERA